MPPVRRRRIQEPIRPTLWDSINTDSSLNLYCRLDDLTNEASVETFFISRLLTDLGYSDSQIQTKQSLESLAVGRGHRNEQYKPDYALVIDTIPRCIIDAKGTGVNIDDWIEQCSGYCLALNRKYPSGENPVRYFMLSNGISTKLYKWDSDIPMLVLSFADFTWGNQQYEQFRMLLSAEKITEGQEKAAFSQGAYFTFTRPTSEWARHLFAICHNIIRKSGYGPAPAFMEFVKIMFVKLWADHGLRENVATSAILAEGKDVVRLPNTAVIFSTRWIKEREAEHTVNPFDTLIFTKLRQDIETKIVLRKKKRLFDREEHINLRPDVIKSVVEKLEHYDMFGVDQDLNGRLFETFLSATMRGRDLGQFFTPRSVVKMMAQLAYLKADRDHRDKVIDACCGTGGFLIEVLTVMRNKIRNNASLSHDEKEVFIEEISNECIYGIDFGKNPPLARIARINMYLHGDGGSCIYATDGLDKDIDVSLETDPETVQNLQELQERLHKPLLFDVALTNPPFSMPKEAKNESDKRIMQRYALAKRQGTSELRSSLRSSVMFLERYHDLLRPGGKLITVLDDTLLASKDFVDVRAYIRQQFLIRAIISLPGDAFRRAGSRVKTSVLVLEKKRRPQDVQPACFAFFAEQLGVDDLTPRASQADIDEARARATDETAQIVTGYSAYLRGEFASLVLTPALIVDRLDLKYCVPHFGRLAPQWQRHGIEVKRFAECVTQVQDNIIRPSAEPATMFTLIKVNYDGRCVVERIKSGRTIRPKTMYQVKAGQMVFSTIRATDGAIGIVPEELDGALVSDTSYTIFQCEPDYDAVYLWALLRSHELRADMQSLSPGSSRYTTPWPDVGRVLIPWLPMDQRQRMAEKILRTWTLEKQIAHEHQEAMADVAALGVESQESVQRWKASKAPQ